MKGFAFLFLIFVLGTALVLNLQSQTTNIVATVTATFTVTERNVLQTEIPQPDGMTKKQVFEIYQDRVLSTTFNGELINATNTVDTGRALIKLVPEDPRRMR